MSVAASNRLDSVSRVGSAPDFWLPWTFRQILALRAAPLAIGAAAVVLSVGMDAVVYTATGAWQGLRVDGIWIWLHPYGAVGLSYALGLGLILVALIYFVRGAERDLAQLEPELEIAPEAFADLRRETLGIPARKLRIGTIVALVMVASNLSMAFASSPLRSYGAVVVGWVVVREVVYELLTLRMFAWAILFALRLSRLSGESLRVRLFDLEALRPVSQNGVRLALIWLLYWAIWVPILFVGVFEGSGLLGQALIASFGIGLSIIAFNLPTRGVRRRLRETKATELARVRDAIELDRGAALDPDHPDRTAAASRLPGLLSYEARVTAVPEWLIDSQTARRFGLYLLIPLASWIGGAMIERVVDAVLD